jgi:hypothetical protein
VQFLRAMNHSQKMLAIETCVVALQLGAQIARELLDGPDCSLTLGIGCIVVGNPQSVCEENVILACHPRTVEMRATQGAMICGVSNRGTSRLTTVEGLLCTTIVPAIVPPQ